MMLGLAAPHTWVAAIMPVLIAYCMASVRHGRPSPLLAILVLVIAVLMQAAVNTLNDYFDYKKGVDSFDDNVEPSDAVLIYNNINPKSALGFAITLLIVAFALGIVIIVQVGWVPLVYAIIGAAVVFLYSGGKTPISYLPIGEAVSGIVMGGLIFMAAQYTFCGAFDPSAILVCLPCVIGIALIMMTNNTCDIEKDRNASRRTMPAMVGRARARAIYHVLMVTMVLIIAIVTVAMFTRGWVVLVFMAVAGYAPFTALWKNPLEPSTRIQAMTQVISVNIVLGLFYAACILAHSVL